MASNATLSASFLETAKDCYSQTSWLFFFIIGKMKDAGGSLLAAIRRIEVDDLKEGLEIFHNWLTWFLGSIFFVLNLTGTGKAANYSVMKAMFAIKFVSFLTTLLSTLSQMHRRNITPLLLILLFECGASLLAVSWISRPALWISLASWPCIFVLLGHSCHPELKEQLLQIKRWFQNHNPEGPSLPSGQWSLRAPPH